MMSNSSPSAPANFLRNQLAPLLTRHLAALLCIAVTTLILRPFDTYLEIQLVALLFLLPVMISTVLWGLTPGVLAGFFAFLAFNYYYIQPYHTFEVHKTQDLITLVIFLIVAVVMSQLIGQARQSLRLARSREWEATRMYELISKLAGLQDTSSIAHALAIHTLETFQFAFVEVCINDMNGQPAFTVWVPEKQAGDHIPYKRIPLITARRQEGDMRIPLQDANLSAEEKRLLEAFTSQGALSIERIRLAKSEQKARVLEESDQLKSSLLNSVSHELRSPLAAIKASVSSLRTGTVEWDMPARTDLLATIEEETDHLNLLVGNLLDMSRIESGALKPLQRWNAISEIALGTVAKMRKQLQEHRLKTSFPNSLPLVPTDFVMIEQVFTNLISNSIKYAPLNTEITISAAQEGDLLRVSLSNQGPGVPEEHLEQIFDKFHRVTEADRVTGTGLGLSICKGIIEAHGGKIWAENQSDSFVFHFTLPLMLNGAFPETPKEETDGERPADFVD